MGSKYVLNSMLGVIFLLLAARPSLADVNVVREVVIGPKGVNGAANIGSVNSSPSVRLANAVVDIVADTPTAGTAEPLSLIVKALFELENETDRELKLTVGFPVSNSQYSSFELAYFRVVTDGVSRDVFQRIGSYPRQLKHLYISGEKGPCGAVPPAEMDREVMNMLGEQFMGQETFGNLLVWEEVFSPGQAKKIEISYEIQVPLQGKGTVKEKVEGNHKGIWPQEANNMPAQFLAGLPEGSYYFFDYYLTSGASWAGPIGSEEVRLQFGPEWQNHDLQTSARGRFLMSGGVNADPGAVTTYYYMLRDEEPADNIYFAVSPRKTDK